MIVNANVPRMTEDVSQRLFQVRFHDVDSDVSKIIRFKVLRAST